MERKEFVAGFVKMAGATGLEPATYGVTGRHSNQLSYAPAGDGLIFRIGRFKRLNRRCQAAGTVKARVSSFCRCRSHIIR